MDFIRKISLAEDSLKQAQPLVSTLLALATDDKNWVSQNKAAEGIRDIIKLISERYASYALVAPKKEAVSSLNGLLEVAEDLIDSVNNVTASNGNISKICAADKRKWPVLVGPRNKDIKVIQKQVKALGLGEAYIKSSNTKPFDASKNLTGVSISLIQYISAYRNSELMNPDEIPPDCKDVHVLDFDEVYPFPRGLADKMDALEEFSGDTAESWAEVSLCILNHFTDGKPEDFPVLARSREDSAKNYAKEVEKGEDEPSVKRRLRFHILTGIRQAFKSLGKHSKEINRF